jgi:glutamate dehydrogenase (NADP+)
MSDSIKKFVDYVAKSNQNEPEFMQAVQEVAEQLFLL